MISFPENEQNFDAACAALSNHRKRESHTPADTLNRLFRKNLSGLFKPEELPVLTAVNTVVTKVLRPKLEWAKLANRSKSDARPSDGPLIVLVYGDMERLIDGNHRCRYWHQTQDPGDHTAFVLIVAERPEQPAA
ncbi:MULTISPECIES: hypothetical protein [unclassified Mesorhizobium]|uniref:hypothetical protein n=1 Tax=unclassified Mesorhizobium TaxID=325217 RepID=UPI000FC9E15B|nr:MULTISPECIES: hypothetical protein [unclassified Mesorhizobium]RUU25000.1 hypothetical protein EOC94_33100 [Mesorhizobium sp. M6A.T.Ce.TU.016.01.1.1]RWB43225.1 MAG: hypothetical protein EOQ42_29790 [Mesorhizobium sp.]RWE91627.1 MAG: hypothetical protein EOS43_32290 [Mesorhizobium sp.]